MDMTSERELQYCVEEELKELPERWSENGTVKGRSQQGDATIHKPRSIDLFLDLRLDVALNPRAFFKKGRVFMTVWAEPRGFSEEVFVEPARFAVVRPHSTFSVCLRINTYGGQGTTKTGLNPRDHAAVIPAGGRFIEHTKGEQLDKEPIEIKIEDQEIEIDPMSRINFAKPYTVEHNVKIRNIGRVFGESVGCLDRYFAESLGYSKP
ncbi:hypothetical protein BKA63DRAFT_113414 [Paraphoma chrysanthemicola]|nr:hypothetical protein BKA63DRAFT_113414 [Paraphoma chrysanthemicola]